MDTVSELPNFDMHPDSPKLEDLGIGLEVQGTSFALGTPIVARGAYLIDQKFERRCAGRPLTHVMVILVRRDQPQGTMHVVQDPHNLADGPADDSPLDPTAMSGGYFNLDLAKFGGLIKQPGRYWVMATMGDYVSKRTEFEVVPGRR
jgi:hypothetical protein